ncbi:phage tail protein [Shewanella sp.]|uniref:phage tail-collar fiber domain-containing protein n=1 Tax=Shewanella sp. TaxID=50422 RepID=UPI003A96F2F6
MAQDLTFAGENLLAQKAQQRQPLIVDTFIFAYIAGLNPDAPIDRNEGLPAVANRVHTQPVSQYGRIGDNTVVYSTVLNSLTGPFQFNWVGLYSSTDDVLFAVQHIPTVPKTVTNGGEAGNTLNRNIGIAYSGIAEITNISVDAATWQLDFNKRLLGMDELHRQLAADMNGQDWFIDDGFLVVPGASANSFNVTAGAGYVSGLRVSLDAVQEVVVSSYPQFIYVDAWFEGTNDSVWKPQLQFTVSNAELDDYTDASGVNHYLCKIAQVTAANSVIDLREKNDLRQGIDSATELMIANGLAKKTKTAPEIGKLMATGIVQKFACVGDSTFWGATAGNLEVQALYNPPATLRGIIQTLFNINCPVDNLAISGSTLRGMISGTDGSGSTFSDKFASGGALSGVDVVFCNHGINDSQLGLDINQYRDDLMSFVSTCKANGATPVLVTPSPNLLGISGMIDESKNRSLMHFVEVMRFVAEQMSVDLVDQFYYWSKSFKKIRAATIIPDGVHMQDIGYLQSGCNLLIPFISAPTLYKKGEFAGLWQNTFYDDGDVNRALTYHAESIVGTFLQFDASAAGERKVIFPFITDDTFDEISILGNESETAAKCTLQFTNLLGIGQFYYNNKQFGDNTADNWTSEYKIRRQLFSGLNILVLTINSNDVGAGQTLYFGGVKTGETTYSDSINGSSYPHEPLGLYDYVTISNFNFQDGTELKLNDMSGEKIASLVVSGTTISCKFFKNGQEIFSNDMSVTFEYGRYDVHILWDQNTVNFNVGEQYYYSGNAAFQVPNYAIGNNCSYKVRPSIVSSHAL